MGPSNACWVQPSASFPEGSFRRTVRILQLMKDMLAPRSLLNGWKQQDSPDREERWFWPAAFLGPRGQQPLDILHLKLRQRLVFKSLGRKDGVPPVSSSRVALDEKEEEEEEDGCLQGALLPRCIAPAPRGIPSGRSCFSSWADTGLLKHSNK